MDKYEVHLERTYSKTIIVTASSEEEACAKVYKSREGQHQNYVGCIGVNVGYADKLEESDNAE